jgi:hypothetical protein
MTDPLADLSSEEQWAAGAVARATGATAEAMGERACRSGSYAAACDADEPGDAFLANDVLIHPGICGG